MGRPRKVDGSVIAADRILDAAEDLFSKRGFDGVTMREVAELANLDAALAHYYFATKQGLFDAVLERRAELVFSERMEAFDVYETVSGDQVTVEGAVAGTGAVVGAVSIASSFAFHCAARSGLFHAE